ncbi:MAG: class I tRNA ligase family protein, partial [Clostridia bacterium]|nr:class I tRNA ligase family protein [Clostridia bacterium]
IFSGIEYTGQVPFDTVLIHGIVRDSQGRKMSKSLGNGVDPLVEIEKYGADALRFSLATGNSPGNDMRYIPERVESSRNFANKLWNASRFILMNLPDDQKAPYLPKNLSLEDKWILSKYNSLVKDVTDNLDKFEIGVAVQKLYDFIWDIFCDWYIELCKVRLNGDDANAADTARAVLVYVMSGMLQLLHPFMPFITEEIWQSLPHDGESIMVSKWPEYSADLDFADDEAEFERVVKAIRAIRVRRSEMNVPPSRKAKVVIESAYADTFNAGAVFFKRLAYAGEVEINKPIDDPSAVTIITDDAKVYMPLGDLIDFEAERTRLNKERDAVLKDITFVENKLNNPGFVSKAPEKVVAEQRKNLEVYKEKLAMLDERLKALQ